MKKRIYIIIPVIMIVLAIIIAVVAALGLLFFNEIEFQVGRVVACAEDAYVFVDENGVFWQMNNASGSKNLFEDLETGDEILVCRSSAMALSYPGQCAVKWCFKLGDGSESDLPQSVLDELERIGWIE